MAQLKIKMPGEAEARRFELVDDIITIGRDPSNTVVLADGATSRRHAEIVRTVRGWAIQDVGSSNGTWVNGDRIRDHLLAHGDELLIGTALMTFDDPVDDGRTVSVDVDELAGQMPEMATQAAARLDIPAAPSAQSEQEQSDESLPASTRTTAVPVRPQPEPPSEPEMPSAAAAIAAEPKHSAPASSPTPVDELLSGPEPAPTTSEPGPVDLPAAALALDAPAIAEPAPEPRAGVSSKTGPLPIGTDDRAAGSVEVRAEGSSGPDYETAGILARAGAYLIDGVILDLGLALVAIPLFWVATSLRDSSPVIFGLVALVSVVVLMVLAAGYLIWFWANQGATPGKKLLKLKVVRQDGPAPLGYTKAAIRALGYVVSGIFGIGFIMAAFNEKGLALHDMMAGTRVIRDR